MRVWSREAQRHSQLSKPSRIPSPLPHPHPLCVCVCLSEERVSVCPAIYLEPCDSTRAVMHTA